MTYRRLLVLYIVWLAMFFLLVTRVFLIASNVDYAAHAKGQTITTLTLANERGNFYDCNGNALTGLYDSWYALCIPGEESYANLYNYVSMPSQSYLYQNRNSGVPFLIDVEQDLTEQGIYTLCAEKRYHRLPLAAHLIGYINQETTGVAGLEEAFDADLSGTGEQGYLQCITNAQGELMDETNPILHESDSMCNNIQLTIDKNTQRAAEGVASAMMEQGAIVVMDVQTAKVRASVSVPTYDPNDVASSLSSENGAFMNRAFSAYSVGSVFKPVLAAAAIEQGLEDFCIHCDGYVDINGQIYRCANGVSHGEVTLSKALEQSCNCYFIALGQELGAQTVEKYGTLFGFGESINIANGLKTASGNMPTESCLTDLGQLANVSFGQGQLLATPLQVAAMMNALANNGVYRAPSYLEGFCDVSVNGTVSITESLGSSKYHTATTRETATKLQHMLSNVVEDGIAGAAKPQNGTAGGKTGTAQTGRYNQEGEEYKDLWFAGFYPAENPQYTIVVMQDDQTQARYSSAAIFAKVCDEINLLSLKSNSQNMPTSNGAQIVAESEEIT